MTTDSSTSYVGFVNYKTYYKITMYLLQLHHVIRQWKTLIPT